MGKILKGISQCINSLRFKVAMSKADECIEFEKKMEKMAKSDNQYLRDYQRAIERKDREGAEKALQENFDHCKNKNSHCLVDVFCPECPFGGMPVVSGRAWMNKEV